VKKATTVAAYLAAHPPEVRKRLALVRGLVRRAAPGALEKISYGIPAYLLEGRLVYFAAHTAHIGIYPITSYVRKEMGDALTPWSTKTAKSTVRLPHDRPIPRALVTKIVKLRVRDI
jgi:uncharacterized protein YdhG (YjbR/CyaY superfamily)